MIPDFINKELLDLKKELNKNKLSRYYPILEGLIMSLYFYKKFKNKK